MKIITVFNNKGGVGKTTLTYHMAHALAEIGKKVLLVDLDPQCNLTIFALTEECIGGIWKDEDDFVEDFNAAKQILGVNRFDNLIRERRSIHFILKPIEDGISQGEYVSPPVNIAQNLDIIPGRLTLHTFEAKVSERFNGIYSGDPLAIRTATGVRDVATVYSKNYGYDLVIFDTSPSLGALNRNILSQADGFIVPGNPDLFSLYGIRNIGAALKLWKGQFNSIYSLLSSNKRSLFPEKFVRFLGYTLYNAKKLQGTKSTNPLGLAKAHFNYAEKIPDVIFQSMDQSDMVEISEARLRESIANGAVIYGHNTFPSMAQKYHLPMWLLPDCSELDSEDAATIKGNRKIYEATRSLYHAFSRDIIDRVEAL